LKYLKIPVQLRYKILFMLLWNLCKIACGKLAPWFLLACKAQTAAAAGLRRGFATPQASKNHSAHFPQEVLQSFLENSCPISAHPRP